MMRDDTGRRNLVPGLMLLSTGLVALISISGFGSHALAGIDVGGAPPLSVAVDIRPGLCPNHLRIGSPFTVPVAVLGTMDLDVTNLDPETIRLSREGMPGECRPASWAYKDVGSPVIGASPECNDPKGDGFDDLRLEFSIHDLATTLGLGEHIGEAVELILTGKVVTGQGIEGRDRLIVLSGEGESEPVDQIGLLAPAVGHPVGGEMKLAYYTNTTDHIRLTIHDNLGRVLATLVDADRAPGIYQVAWSGTGRGGHEVPPGTYFARVCNSQTGITRKLVVPQ